MSENDKKITAIECRFATHCKSNESNDDIHIVKEIVHYDDKTTVARLQNIKNYKRPFYIVKKGRRDFKDKKEWIKKEDLDRFECTQNDLVRAAARASGQFGFRGGLKDLCESPYIFGADITSTAIIKRSYQKKWDIQTPYKVAVFDTETDMVDGHERIIMATTSCREDVFTVVKKSFLKGIADAEKKIQEACKKYLGDIMQARGIKEINLNLVDDEIDIVTKSVKHMHETSPDFVAVWNIKFDMEKMLEECERAGINPKDLFTDPSLPKEYRSFKYDKGSASKKMASGRMLNFKPSQQWHKVLTPSSFYWIDAMQAYRQVRSGAPEEQSYKLEFILNKEIKMGKLKFAEADAVSYSSAAWHKYMQQNYPIEYVVYNIFDCIGVELLDEKTNDLRLTLPMLAGTSDFQKFNSLPRKVMDDLHWHCEEEGLIPGSTASEMIDEIMEDGGQVSGWIVMLASHPVEDNGLKNIEEDPNITTSIRIGVADLDVAGAYPENGKNFNVSKETTSKELIRISGYRDEQVRMQTINFSGGITNAAEFCQVMYKLPAMPDLLDAFKEDMAKQCL
jgi:hypothetical protein